MIASGEKLEEYREIKPYYRARLVPYFGKQIEGTNSFMLSKYGNEKVVIFRNGYSYTSPKLKCNCTLHFGEGKPEWRSYTREKLLHLDNQRGAK